MNIGDRVKFRTVGGWYNSGIIKDMNEESYLIEVDKSEDIQISLPYYVRVLSSCEIINENLVVKESEEKIWQVMKSRQK